jgi:hypothetical protein
MTRQPAAHGHCAPSYAGSASMLAAVVVSGGQPAAHGHCAPSYAGSASMLAAVTAS